MKILDREINPLTLVLYLVVTLSLYFGLFYVVDFVSDYSLNFNNVPILAVVIIYSISLTIRGYRYNLIVNALNTLPVVGGSEQEMEEINQQNLKTSVYGVFVAWGLNSFVPARLGEVSRIYLSDRLDGIDQKRAFDSIILEKLFDISMISILTLLSLAVVVMQFTLPRLLIENAIIISIAFVITIFGFIVLLNLDYVLPILESVPRVGNFVSSMLEILYRNSTALINDKKRFGTVVLCSMLIWIMDTLTLVIIGLQFIDLPVVVLFVSGIVGFLAFILPILPNAVGQFEVIVGLLFAAFGYNFDLGFQIALMDHFIKVVTAMMLGGLSVITIFVTGRLNSDQTNSTP